MSQSTVVDVVLRNALRQLADEARRVAALLHVGSADHDFYVGVQRAAEERLSPGLAASDRSDIDRRSPAFREGYVKASTMIAEALTLTTPIRFRLPVLDAR